MIRLYGDLLKKFGKELNCKVNSVYELMQAMDSQRPGFRAAIDKDKGYVIRRGDTFKLGINVSEEEIEMRFNDEVWHVLPVPAGSGKFGKIILGAALVIIGAVMNIYAPGSGTFLIKAGAGIMLGGIADLLSPVPGVTSYSDRNDPDSRPSYIFNGPLNRTESGGAVPLIYGKDVFVGSVFVSGGLEIGDIA